MLLQVCGNITINAYTGTVTLKDAVALPESTTLGGTALTDLFADKDNTYTKSEVNELINSMKNWWQESLPTEEEGTT